MEEAKNLVLKFSENEYFLFMREVNKQYPKKSRELTNRVVNNWKRDEAKIKKATSSSGNFAECAKAALKSTDEVGSSGQGKSLLPTVQIPQPHHWQISAWKSGFIFRGDKIPANGRLFIDWDMVTLKKQFGREHEQGAGTVSIVNEDGKLILWAFIKHDLATVCQYGPKLTNLNAEILRTGVELKIIQLCLEKCKKDNLLVGFGLEDGLASLEFCWENQLDLQRIFQDEKGGFALAWISRKLMDNRSRFQRSHHSAIDSSRMILAIYKKYLEWENSGDLPGKIKKLSASRDEFNNTAPTFYENCNCPK